MRENPAIFEALDVSNPLRLEGDADHCNRVPCTKPFLIHYGWRRTQRFSFYDGAVASFLIHYGWRGTRADRKRRSRSSRCF